MMQDKEKGHIFGKMEKGQLDFGEITSSMVRFLLHLKIKHTASMRLMEQLLFESMLADLLNSLFCCKFNISK